MKTLFISAVAALALFTACTGTEKTDKAESTLATKIENCTNTDSLKAYVDEAKAYIVKLQSEGKVDEAKKFLEKIQPVVKDKAPALAGTFAAIGTTLDKVTDKAEAKADSAKAAVADSIDSKINDAKSAVSDVADKAKEVGSNTAEKVKDAVGNAVDNTKEAAADAAQKAADKLRK
ncbi:MAG: hypothetical protein K2I18_05100 [Paramuribaculum sp.]|nr:hypothetical protein [Paramuribaculum sp.]